MSMSSSSTQVSSDALQAGPQAQPPQPTKPQAFPKTRRLLKRAQFRQVYDQGFRVVASCFVAFCWKDASEQAGEGPKIGFTTPRALGKAVKRNRMRRRLRETVRRRLHALAPEWRIVWNLRKPAFDAPQHVLESEVERVLARCNR